MDAHVLAPHPLATFTPFGTEHWLLVALMVAVCPFVAVLGRRVRGGPAEQTVCRAFALLLVATTVPLQVAQWLPADYDLDTSWPLQFCDLSWMLAAVALWTRNRRATLVLYYWTLVLVPQAVLTPDLVNGFPHPRYLGFWAMHFLTVWAGVLLTFGLGERPSWRGYRLAVAVTVGWAAFLMCFNGVVGTNYGYLNGKPAGGSLLDLFGPWPFYVVVEVAVVAVVWALITWPWTRRSRSARVATTSTGAGEGVAGVPDAR